MKELKLTKRVTSSFLSAVPPQIKHFDGYIYAIVNRKPNKVIENIKYGQNVRIDPVEFDWISKTLTMTIPLNINPGIQSFDDLDENFMEGVEAAMLIFMRHLILDS